MLFVEGGLAHALRLMAFGHSLIVWDADVCCQVLQAVGVGGSRFRVFI